MTVRGIEELEEHIALLRSLLVDLNVQPPFEWGLTPTQTLIFGALVNRERCTVAYIGEILADRAGVDASSSANVGSIMWHMRTKLTPFGVIVGKAYAGSYSLDPATRIKYRTSRRSRLDEFMKQELGQ